ncbi:MAG: chitobiase/beta-hexosaminidase C-terminal domain-containing protein [Verrucomicrobia bacterium]|nr:chitobiase/beta-hexosaminidase C-terminal domain-containing protein [Verrucomicrobiota bacterium]
MDEFAVYNRALSAPEIQAIASARGSGKRLEVAAPIISPYGGVFTGSVSVTLSTSTSGATIRYTTNGSEPTSGSTLYTAPFLLTQNATVKAKAFKSGMADSVTTTSAPFVLLGRGPVGWWKLDEGDGSVAFDSSGGGHTGTLLNGPAWINGRVGAGALSFDGANDSVTVPDQADLRLGTNLTLACWFKKQGEPGDRTRLVGKGNSTSRNYNVWEEAGADKRILFQIYMTSGAYLNLYSTVNLEVGVWYHVGCTYDGATARIYINGTPAGQLTMSGVTPRTSNHPVTFGYAGFHTYLNGALDDVRLYDRALTAAEMADLAAAWQQPIVIIPSLWVNTTTISGTVEGRLPAGMAFLVNSEDFASATWEAFHSPFSVNLGPGDGARDVWIGFMDFSGVQTWQKHQVILDTTPPVLTLTEPLSGTTSQPFVQVKGSANEPLTAVTFDLVNGNGTLSDEPGLLLGETYDENAFLQEPPEGEAPPPQPIAWPFQLFDVELADGANALTLRATDRAGNTATVPLNYTLDLTTDHTAPVITLHWPQNNAQLATDTFDLRGQLDDPCATVTVTGLTAEPVAGLVERNGLFWVEGLPLAPGINTLTVVATDAAGNARSQALTLTRATALTVTISEPTEEQLAAPLVTVFGTITDNQHDVWVNGVRVPAAALIPEGGVYAWQADSVPLGDGGTAVIQARAIPVGAPHGAPPPFDPVSLGNPAAEQARDAQRQWDRPARTYVGRYFEVCWHLIPRCEQTRTEFTYMTVRWGSEDGRRHLITRDPTYGTSETLQLWPAYTDEGIGIGCLPPAGRLPGMHARRVRLLVGPAPGTLRRDRPPDGQLFASGRLHPFRRYDDGPEHRRQGPEEAAESLRHLRRRLRAQQSPDGAALSGRSATDAPDDPGRSPDSRQGAGRLGGERWLSVRRSARRHRSGRDAACGGAFLLLRRLGHQAQPGPDRGRS